MSNRIASRAQRRKKNELLEGLQRTANNVGRGLIEAPGRINRALEQRVQGASQELNRVAPINRNDASRPIGTRRSDGKVWSGQSYGWQSSQSHQKLQQQGTFRGGDIAGRRILSDLGRGIDPRVKNAAGQAARVVANEATHLYNKAPKPVQAAVRLAGGGLKNTDRALENVSRTTNTSRLITDDLAVGALTFGASKALKAAKGVANVVDAVPTRQRSGGGVQNRIQRRLQQSQSQRAASSRGAIDPPQLPPAKGNKIPDDLNVEKIKAQNVELSKNRDITGGIALSDAEKHDLSVMYNESHLRGAKQRLQRELEGSNVMARLAAEGKLKKPQRNVGASLTPAKVNDTKVTSKHRIKSASERARSKKAAALAGDSSSRSGELRGDRWSYVNRTPQQVYKDIPVLLDDGLSPKKLTPKVRDQIVEQLMDTDDLIQFGNNESSRRQDIVNDFYSRSYTGAPRGLRDSHADNTFPSGVRWNSNYETDKGRIAGRIERKLESDPKYIFNIDKPGAKTQQQIENRVQAAQIYNDEASRRLKRRSWRQRDAEEAIRKSNKEKFLAANPEARERQGRISSTEEFLAEQQWYKDNGLSSKPDKSYGAEEVKFTHENHQNKPSRAQHSVKARKEVEQYTRNLNDLNNIPNKPILESRIQRRLRERREEFQQHLDAMSDDAYEIDVAKQEEVKRLIDQRAQSRINREQRELENLEERINTNTAKVQSTPGASLRPDFSIIDKQIPGKTRLNNSEVASLVNSQTVPITGGYTKDDVLRAAANPRSAEARDIAKRLVAETDVYNWVNKNRLNYGKNPTLPHGLRYIDNSSLDSRSRNKLWKLREEALMSNDFTTWLDKGQNKEFFSKMVENSVGAPDSPIRYEGKVWLDSHHRGTASEARDKYGSRIADSLKRNKKGSPLDKSEKNTRKKVSASDDAPDNWKERYQPNGTRVPGDPLRVEYEFEQDIRRNAAKANKGRRPRNDNLGRRSLKGNQNFEYDPSTGTWRYVETDAQVSDNRIRQAIKRRETTERYEKFYGERYDYTTDTAERNRRFAEEYGTDVNENRLHGERLRTDNEAGLEGVRRVFRDARNRRGHGDTRHRDPRHSLETPQEPGRIRDRIAGNRDRWGRYQSKDKLEKVDRDVQRLNANFPYRQHGEIIRPKGRVIKPRSQSQSITNTRTVPKKPTVLDQGKGLKQKKPGDRIRRRIQRRRR